MKNTNIIKDEDKSAVEFRNKLKKSKSINTKMTILLDAIIASATIVFSGISFHLLENAQPIKAMCIAALGGAGVLGFGLITGRGILKNNYLKSEIKDQNNQFIKKIDLDYGRDLEKNSITAVNDIKNKIEATDCNEQYQVFEESIALCDAHLDALYSKRDALIAYSVLSDQANEKILDQIVACKKAKSQLNNYKLIYQKTNN